MRIKKFNRKMKIIYNQIVVWNQNKYPKEIHITF